MSEVNLPKDWMKCKSKKHPDRFYYFNKATGETSWIPPNSNDKTSTVSPSKAKNDSTLPPAPCKFIDIEYRTHKLNA